MAELAVFAEFVFSYSMNLLAFLYLKRNKLVFHLEMEDAKSQRWILRTVSCSILSDHPFNFYTMTVKMSHILQRTPAHLILLTHIYNGSFHFIFKNI